MSSQFPAFRLATLLARQLSAPLAARIKRYARAQGGAGRAACAAAGRAHRAADLRLRLWVLRLPQPRSLPPLSDDAALNAGADIIGEVVIFALGSAIVIFEVNRQAQIQEDKVLSRRSARLALALQLEELVREVTRQEEELRRLQDLLRAEARRREGAADR